MEITKRKENTAPNIWTAQENLIHFYRLTTAALGILSIFLFGAILIVAMRNPVVVLKSQGAQEFYPTVRQKVSIEKVDVEAFTKAFLSKLYVWQDFNADRLKTELEPFAEPGLVQKIADGQTQKYGKELKGKRLSQAITFVSVQVLDDRVVARFDRVLKIEGIPLVIPTEATLSMIEGDGSRLNPIGITVTGIVEREGAK
jgi:hypothetical protein